MKSFSKLSLGVRLAIGFAVILILVVAMTIVGFVYMTSIHDHLTAIVATHNKIELAATIEDNIKTRAIMVRTILLTDNASTKEASLKRFEEQQESYKGAIEKLQSLVKTEEGKKLLDKVKEGGEAAQPSLNKAVELGKAGKMKEGNQVLEQEYGPAQVKWSGARGDLVKLQQEQSQKSIDDAKKAYAASRVLFFALGSASLILGALIAFFLTRSITKPVSRIIEGLSNGAEQVASASSQVTSASGSLAEGASEQAAGIEETSSSIEEMSAMTKQNAENANQANTLMTETTRVVDDANRAMSELTESMKEMTAASEETAKIIKTIDEIAFQTNLLALNAAVEAARAGEAGAGFAVVSDEVRNLALRAADAAKNTANLIEGTVKKIKNGSDIVTKTNEAFVKVATGAKKVGELVGEISAASQEQSQGVEQINKAVIEMDQVVQKNAASAEESASASEELNAQAEQMREYVKELLAVVEGSGDNAGRDLSFTEGRRRHPAAAVRRPAAGAIIPSGHGKKEKAAVKEVRPEQVIPLEKENFKEF